MDIVQRLRRPVNPPICDEAADEIERLREANKCLDSARTVLMPLLQEEAARYCWLRDVGNPDDSFAVMESKTSDWGRFYWDQLAGANLDARIDAAMAREA